MFVARTTCNPIVFSSFQIHVQNTFGGCLLLELTRDNNSSVRYFLLWYAACLLCWYAIGFESCCTSPSQQWRSCLGTRLTCAMCMDWDYVTHTYMYVCSGLRYTITKIVGMAVPKAEEQEWVGLVTNERLYAVPAYIIPIMANLCKALLILLLCIIMFQALPYPQIKVRQNSLGPISPRTPLVKLSFLDSAIC